MASTSLRESAPQPVVETTRGKVRGTTAACLRLDTGPTAPETRHRRSRD